MAFSFRGDLTIDQQFFTCVVAGLFQLHLHLFGQLVKGGPDAGFRCTGAHQITTDPVAQNSADGVDQNRLTCAGFTGQNIQSGGKLYLNLFNYCNIFNS